MEMLMFKPAPHKGTGHLLILYSQAVLQVPNILVSYFASLFLGTSKTCYRQKSSCRIRATADHVPPHNTAQEHPRDKRKLLQACSLKYFHLRREGPLKDCFFPTLLCLTFPRFYFQKLKKGLLRASGQLTQHAQELPLPSSSKLFRQLSQTGKQRSFQLSKNVFLQLKAFQTNTNVFHNVALNFPNDL